MYVFLFLLQKTGDTCVGNRQQEGDILGTQGARFLGRLLSDE